MKAVAEMTEQEKTQIRAWIKNWQELEPILEKMRRDSLLRHVDTAQAIGSFDLAYKSARLHCPRRETSGLVEQQRWFKRGYK